MTLFKHHIFVCTNQREAGHELGCCASKGSIDVLAALKLEAKKQGMGTDIRINKAGCLAQCDVGPAIVVYPQSTWYANVQVGDAQEIVTALKSDQKVTRLLHPGVPR